MSNFNQREQALLFELIEKLTGSNQSGVDRKEFYLSNAESLMIELGCKTFEDFLIKIDADKNYLEQFISTITIHTTSWFREREHFNQLEKLIEKKISIGQNKFKIWSCAASTGQEPYSIALVCEKIKTQHPDFDYEIIASDIDQLSLQKAKSAIFQTQFIESIPREYHSYLLIGQNKLEGYFTLTKEIRDRCKFIIHNLDEDFPEVVKDFDFVFCRNVLIYFHPNKVRRIIKKLISSSKIGSIIILGHSEAVNEKFNELKKHGRSIYSVEQNISFQKNQLSTNINKSVKNILIVDDLPMIRVPLKLAFKKANYATLEAGSAEEATEIIKNNQVDLITLDLGLPGQNGIHWLKDFRAMGHQTPVLIISGSSPNEADQVYGALDNGAQDFFEKEKLSSNINRLIETTNSLLQSKYDNVLFIPASNISPVSESTKETKLILIGASTGGPEAIWKILNQFPQPCPPIVIVQHTSPFFAPHFAKTVSKASGLKAGGDIDGQELLANHVYVAHGDYHLELKKSQNKITLHHSASEPMHGHRPSVDKLFYSASLLQIPLISILLTGMGNDGASGLLELMKTNLSYNIAQSADSCIVFGMPKEAIKLGCVHFVGDLDSIKNKLFSILQNNQIPSRKSS